MTPQGGQKQCNPRRFHFRTVEEEPEIITVIFNPPAAEQIRAIITRSAYLGNVFSFMRGGRFSVVQKVYISAVLFPPITGGGGERIKMRLISNPGLLLPPPPLLLVVPSVQPPCSCQVAVPLLRGGFIHEEEGRGGKQAQMKMAAVCLRVPTTPCQLGIVIPSAACLP